MLCQAHPLNYRLGIFPGEALPGLYCGHLQLLFLGVSTGAHSNHIFIRPSLLSPMVTIKGLELEQVQDFKYLETI
uniref:Uncharacterized protein n=1 Tax=Anguilla anguilla TaxID=7936 RepID=A0A0E9WRV8_ANGAN